MRDVAALAGVSLKTVSRVVNGVATVDRQMTERVQVAAVKLGYIPDASASNLRRSNRRSNSIGLLVDYAADPYCTAVLAVLDEHYWRNDTALLVSSHQNDAARERQAIEALASRRVDGVLVIPAPADHRYLVENRLAETSFVFIERPPTPLVADAVLHDERGGGVSAARYLLRAGRVRLGYLGGDLAIPATRRRFEGYRDTLQRMGVALDSRLTRHGIRTIAQASRVARDMLTTDGLQGIFANHTLTTLAVSEQLRMLDLHERISFVGIDHAPPNPAAHHQATVLARSPHSLALLASELLAARIAGEDAVPRIHEVPLTLIERGTGEAW